MPLYEYRCPDCRQTFEALRPMREAASAATCPKGHAGAERVVSLIASSPRGEGNEAFSNGGGGCACGGGACGCGR